MLLGSVVCHSLLVAQELASELFIQYFREERFVGLWMSPVPRLYNLTTNSHHEAPAAKSSSAGAWTPGSLYGNFCKNCLAGYDRLHGIGVVGALQLAQCLCVLFGLKFGL